MPPRQPGPRKPAPRPFARAMTISSSAARNSWRALAELAQRGSPHPALGRARTLAQHHVSQGLAGAARRGARSRGLADRDDRPRNDAAVNARAIASTTIVFDQLLYPFRGTARRPSESPVPLQGIFREISQVIRPTLDLSSKTSGATDIASRPARKPPRAQPTRARSVRCCARQQIKGDFMATTTVDDRRARVGGQSDATVIFASSLGTVFEWYDFYIYGTLGAILASKFFSGVAPTVGLHLHAARLRGRLRGAPVRRAGLRPARRPRRPQIHLPRHHDADGHRHVPDRRAADLRVNGASRRRSC